MLEQNTENTTESYRSNALYKKDLKKQIEVLLANDSYITWLEKFTSIYPFFTDVDSLKTTDINVKNLNTFFRGIESYAVRNGISRKATDYGYCHLVQYNNICYEIGVACTTTSYTYCQRLDNFEGSTVIDFNEVINEDLSLFEECVEKLLKKDIPAETLIRIFNNVLAKHTKK